MNCMKLIRMSFLTRTAFWSLRWMENEESDLTPEEGNQRKWRSATTNFIIKRASCHVLLEERHERLKECIRQVKWKSRCSRFTNEIDLYSIRIRFYVLSWYVMLYIHSFSLHFPFSFLSRSFLFFFCNFLLLKRSQDWNRSWNNKNKVTRKTRTNRFLVTCSCSCPLLCISCLILQTFAKSIIVLSFLCVCHIEHEYFFILYCVTSVLSQTTLALVNNMVRKRNCHVMCHILSWTHAWPAFLGILVSLPCLVGTKVTSNSQYTVRTDRTSRV